MTEKQRVFVRGVEGRGDEVIKALTDLGGKKPPFDIGGDPSYIFYITHEGNITGALYDSEVGKIIMDFYHEVKLPEQWKDGDILVDNDDPTKFLVKLNAWTGPWINPFKAHLLVNPTSIGELPIANFCNADYHKADSEELRKFHELLHKYGKEWDAEKKQLVDWRWKPKMNETYWFIAGCNTIIRSLWANTSLDNKYFEIGNCFQSRKEAREAMAEKIKKLLKGE